MVYPRLQHLLATLLPSLFFTLTDTADPVFAFSVAGLVVALVVSLFPLCLMVSVYETLAFYYPRVIIFYIPSFIVHSMNAFPTVLANPSFLALYASVMMVARLLVFRYLEDVMAERILRPQIITLASQCAQVRQAIAFQESKLRRALESCTATEMEMHALESERSKLETDLEEIENAVIEAQRRTKQHKCNIKEHKEDIESLRFRVSSFKNRIQHEVETAFKRKCEEVKAAHKTRFKVLALTQRREEHQAFISAKKGEQVKAHLTLVNEDINSITAAYRTALIRFEREQQARIFQYSALQGSLEFAVTEHRFHMEQCERDHERAQDDLKKQVAALEAASSTHSIQLAAAQRLHKLRTSALKAKNDLIRGQLTSAIATRNSIMARHQAHNKRTDMRLTKYEARYIALEGSLEFANAEHRIHVEHCERERAQDEARIEELLVQLSAERTVRVELQAEHDGLQARHVIVSEGYAEAEARLKTTIGELYLERQRHRATIDTYQAGQHVSDALMDDLVPALKKRSPQQTPCLLRRALLGQTPSHFTTVKANGPSCYREQLTQISLSSTLFDEFWLLPQSDFVQVEGSSKDGSLTSGSILAPLTSTPLRSHNECPVLPSFKFTATHSDTSLADTIEEHQ
ncbi:hypothetical protein BDY19DRAFT_991826 [Irpex rosettiformis]|uniref:Uncharacterized protein n=1 Tax=Irpex rosettiformis TaxID=378272 RepID=A0ACB8UAD5_9APHY|nr:hypothetical protein BDY19DRAFT_991826 [Irpex rosettiformis]